MKMKYYLFLALIILAYSLKEEINEEETAEEEAREEEEKEEREEEEYDPYAQRDPCESTYNPKGWSECKGKGTYTNEWVCCYIEGTRPDFPNKTYCADVWKEDIKTEEGKKQVEEDIRNGSYWAWDDVPFPVDLQKMICKDNSDSYLNFKLMSSLFLLISIFVF